MHQTSAAPRNPATIEASTTSPRASRAKLGFALAAAVLLIVVAAVASLYIQRDTYATAFGEQRTLALSDGSRVELNAHSKIRVRYTAGARRIDLLEGQALFHVAHDAARPFTVTTDTTQVRAVGTQFDVYRKEKGTVVTVVEGKVAVAEAGAGLEGHTSPDRREEASTRGVQAQPGEILLAAGEQAFITTRDTIRRTLSETATRSVTAWTDGRLVFQGTLLGEVVDEFNRYNARQLILTDPQLATLKITGIFSSTDPASLVRFLQARPGISVTQTRDEIRITRH